MEIKAPVDITSVRVITRVPELELASEFSGATIELTAINAPPSDDEPMRLVILGPASIYAQPVTAGQPVVIEPAIAERILKEQGMDDFIAQLKAAGAL